MGKDDGIYLTGKKLAMILTVFSIISIAGTWIVPMISKRYDFERRLTAVETSIQNYDKEREKTGGSIEVWKTENKEAHELIQKTLMTMNRELGEIAGTLGIKKTSQIPQSESFYVYKGPKKER
jgi:hypothetical protein